MKHEAISTANVHGAEALAFVAAVQATESSLERLRRDLALEQITPETFQRRRGRIKDDVHVGLKIAAIYAHLAVAEEIALTREALLVRGTGSGVIL